MAAWKWKLDRQRRPDYYDVPAEFLCPISGRPMSDPVIISSGQSFDHVSIQACNALGVVLLRGDAVLTDLKSFFPNTNLKCAILNNYRRHSVPPPDPLEFHVALDIVSALVTAKNSQCRLTKADNSVHRGLSSSVDSLGSTTRSSSEFKLSISEHDRFLLKMQSTNFCDIEEESVCFRNITHSDREHRVALCTDQMLVVLRSLIISSHQRIQLNSLAALVNLSLEKVNKAKMARSGILPNLIDLLKGSGSDEAQEHASAALFSLSLDDYNKAAIGALGGLPPFLRTLRSNNIRTRSDSAAALYHLSLVRGNRIKLLKLGAVPILLSMMHSENTNQFENRNRQSRHRILLVLYNIGLDEEGRVAMLDASAVESLIGLLRGANLTSKAEQASILDVLFRLNRGGPRFRWLVKEAGGEEVLNEIAAEGKEGKQKVANILELIRGRREEEEEEADGQEDVDWEKLLLS